MRNPFGLADGITERSVGYPETVRIIGLFELRESVGHS